MLPPKSYSIAELEKLSGFDRRTIVYYIQEGLLPKVGRRGPRTRYPAESLARLRFIKRVRELQDAGHLGSVTLSDIRDVMDANAAEAIERLGGTGLAAAYVEALFSEENLQRARELAAVRPPPEAELAGYSLEDEEEDFDTGRMASASQRRLALSEKAHFSAPDAGPPAPRSRKEALRDEFWDKGAEIFERVRAGATPEASAERAELAVASSLRRPSRDEELLRELRQLLRDIDRSALLGQKLAGRTAPERLTRVPLTGFVSLTIQGLREEDVELAERLAGVLQMLLGR